MAHLSCALLFALPIDRSEFDDVLSGRALPDYRRLLVREDQPEGLWQERYARVVEAAQDLVAVARSRGVSVVARATLESLATASRALRALIVVGHWRGWVVNESDLRGTAEEIVAQLNDANLSLESGEVPTSLRELVNALNVEIDGGKWLGRTYPNLAATPMSEPMRAALGRDLLDEALGELIAPGNMVEMYDGLHTPLEFENALDPAFQGELDLATCTSAPLATMISRRRGSAVRIVHTVALVDPLACYIALTETLRLWADIGGTYTSARLEVERWVADVRRQLRAGKRL